MSQVDWVFELKSRVKRHRRLATLIFYVTDLLHLNAKERSTFVRSFPPGAVLLNLGAGFRSSPRGFLAVDREAYLDVDVRADLGALPFRDGTVDGILCEMVLEHISDSSVAIGEFGRVLKPGGRLYVAVPFLWPYHASPHDYWRWTASGVERQFASFETITMGASGGPTVALVNVLHEWLAMVLSCNVEILYRFFYLALIPALFPFKLLDVVVARHRHAAKIGSLFYLHGRKPDAGARRDETSSSPAANPTRRETR